MTNRKNKNKVEQADGSGGSASHRDLKKRKRRLERHRAKQDPEVPPGYGKYSGYET